MVKTSWELIDLRVLCAVAQRANFSAAAVDLGISVAYVTKRMAHLEQVLGAQLFVRSTRKVSITPLGESVFLWARKVLDAAQDLNNEVALSHGHLLGALRISTSQRLGSLHIAHILALLRQEHPGLDVWLELVDRRVDLVAERFDVDIRVGEVEEPHLVSQKIASSARVLCASPAYLESQGQPQALADLAHHACLMFRERDQPFSMLRLQGPQGQESVHVSGHMGSNQSDVIHSWALHGMGVALLSRWAIAEHLRQGLLVPVLPQYSQQADIYAVTPLRANPSAKLKQCLQYLSDQLVTGPYALDLR